MYCRPAEFVRAHLGAIAERLVHTQQRRLLATGCGRLAAEAGPVLVELAPLLGDAAGADAVLAGQIPGPLAHRHVQHQAAVAVGQVGQPGREIDAEGRLVGHLGLRVVLQGFLDGLPTSVRYWAVCRPRSGGCRWAWGFRTSRAFSWPQRRRPEFLTARAAKVAMAVAKREGSLPCAARPRNHFQALCRTPHKACYADYRIMRKARIHLLPTPHLCGCRLA